MTGDEFAVPQTCDCIHGPELHDPVSGACLWTNPIHGPCPCAATRPETRRALEVVHAEFRKLVAADDRARVVTALGDLWTVVRMLRDRLERLEACFDVPRRKPGV